MKTRKIKIFRDFRFFFSIFDFRYRLFILSHIPKNESSETQKLYKKAIILKCKNVVEMLVK